MPSRLPWRIDRLELAYSNPRHNRWQLFQCTGEQPASQSQTESAHYRDQIQGLLNSVGKTLQAALPASSEPISWPETKPESYSGPEFHLGENVIMANKLLTTGKLTSADLSKVVPGYRELLADEGLPKGPEQSKQKIEQLFESVANYTPGAENAASSDLFSFITQQIRKNAKHKGPPDDEECTCSSHLNRNEALDLMSVLPILKHWDLWGLLLPSWLRDPGSSWQETQDKGRRFRYEHQWEPFYTARLTFKDQTTGISGGFLGYQVEVEICAPPKGNHQRRKARTRRVETTDVLKGDFFEFCFLPTSEAEKSLYLTYAIFIDTIQRKLSDIDSRGKPTNLWQRVRSIPGKRPTHVYLVCYPIDVRGRRHFVQFFLRPDPRDRRSPGAQDLWHVWKKLHDKMFGHQLVGLVAQGLTQIGIAVFQLSFTEKLLKQRLQDANQRMGSEDLRTTFCELAPAAFPLKAIYQRPEGARTLNALKWKYEPREEKGIRWGDAWKGTPSAATLTIPEHIEGIAFEFPGSSENDALQPLRDEYARQFLLRRWKMSETLNSLPPGSRFDRLIAYHGRNQKHTHNERAELEEFSRVVERLDLLKREQILGRLETLSKFELGIEDVPTRKGNSSLLKEIPYTLDRWTLLSSGQKEKDPLYAEIKAALKVTWRRILCAYPGAKEKTGLLSHPHQMFEGFDPDEKAESYKKVFAEVEAREFPKAKGDLYKTFRDCPSFEDLKSALEAGEGKRATEAWQGFQSSFSQPFKDYRQTFGAERTVSEVKGTVGSWQCSQAPGNIWESLAGAWGISPLDVRFIDRIAHDNGAGKSNPVKYLGVEMNEDLDLPRDRLTVHLVWAFEGPVNIAEQESSIADSISQAHANLLSLDSGGLPDIARIVCYRYRGRFSMFTGSRVMRVSLGDSQLAVSWDNSQTDRFYYFCCIGECKSCRINASSLPN